MAKKRAKKVADNSDSGRLPFDALSRNKEHGVGAAPGQALGYGLQYTRFAQLLLQANPNSFVGFEVLDDVSIEDAGGPILVGQTKSVTANNNPVADRATGLWKTIANWIRTVQKELIDPQRAFFEIYVSQPVSGKIVSAFDAATTEKDSRSAVAMARQELWGRPPAFNKRSSVGRDLAEYLEIVFGADENVLLPIVTGLRLKCGSGSPLSDLESEIAKMPILPNRVRMLTDHICGWVKNRVDHYLEQGHRAIISKDEFQSEFIAFAQKINREDRLISFAPAPSQRDQQVLRPRTFVRQLDLIELEEVEILQAISDYYRACRDRTDWAKQGIHESSFEDLNDALVGVWRRLKREIGITHKTVEAIDQGKLVHDKSMQHQSKLQNLDAPEHFARGCFHRLADDAPDSPDGAPVIGWHPDFGTLLKSGRKAVGA